MVFVLFCLPPCLPACYFFCSVFARFFLVNTLGYLRIQPGYRLICKAVWPPQTLAATYTHLWVAIGSESGLAPGTRLSSRPTRSDRRTEYESQCREILRAIWWLPNLTIKEWGLDYVCFSFHFSNDSFLLYFIKVLLHNGLKFIKKERGGGSGGNASNGEQTTCGLGTPGPEYLMPKAFPCFLLPLPHLPDLRKLTTSFIHPATLQKSSSWPAFPSLIRNERTEAERGKAGWYQCPIAAVTKYHKERLQTRHRIGIWFGGQTI